MNLLCRIQKVNSFLFYQKDGKAMNGTAEVRFWAKIEKTDSCWLWKDALTSYGNGRLLVNGEAIAAHRYSYELHFGPTPAGVEILHTCNNPACVNPSHLFLGTTENRFWGCVQKTDTCWLWTGNKQKGGYGRIKTKGKSIKAHRYSWELHNGPVPVKLYVLHHCDNPGCVNPAHLFLGTYADNSADMVSKGRSVRGEKHRSAKLVESDIAKIFDDRKNGMIYKDIANKYGVNDRQISNILNRQSWTHVKVSR